MSGVYFFCRLTCATFLATVDVLRREFLVSPGFEFSWARHPSLDGVSFVLPDFSLLRDDFVVDCREPCEHSRCRLLFALRGAERAQQQQQQ